MRKNVLLLSLCQALMNSGNALLGATSALVGQYLAANKSLATLPLALQFLATMLTTIPASLLMKHIGRKAGFIVGTFLGITGAGLAAWAIVHGSFLYFCVGAALFGGFNGFGTYYRFAAADVASESYRSTAISYVMAGGVIAAFVGPNLANWTSAWLSYAPFAGSYLALAGIYLASLLVLLFLRIPPLPRQESQDSGRSLRTIVAQESFIVAVLASMLGYGIMVLVMTATPLAMHVHAYVFHDTAFVIQWHVFGMFAPSFVTGHLIRRFGVLNILLAGALLNVLGIGINLSGSTMLHFSVALFLVGVGWNFLFVGGTALLTETYRVEEKAKTQALNDFLMFASITIASVSAGALQYNFGWQVVNMGVIPLIALILIAVIGLKRRRMMLAITPV